MPKDLFKGDAAFFEKLASAKSLREDTEIRTEYTKAGYETFVAESQRIRELHSEMTVQRLRNLESFVARMKPTRSS